MSEKRSFAKRLEVFRAMKIRVVVFRGVTPCSGVVNTEAGSTVLQNLDILPRHYKALQNIRS
jgi:hypothetical protein